MEYTCRNSPFYFAKLTWKMFRFSIALMGSTYVFILINVISTLYARAGFIQSSIIIIPPELMNKYFIIMAYVTVQGLTRFEKLRHCGPCRKMFFSSHRFAASDSTDPKLLIMHERINLHLFLYSFVFHIFYLDSTPQNNKYKFLACRLPLSAGPAIWKVPWKNPFKPTASSPRTRRNITWRREKRRSRPHSSISLIYLGQLVWLSGSRARAKFRGGHFRVRKHLIRLVLMSDK